jgi:hypothetical protein
VPCDSVFEAARNGLEAMQFAYRPIDVQRQEVRTYARTRRELHRTAPPIPLFADLSVCDENADHAAEMANAHVRRYLLSLFHHYAMFGDHLANAQGHEEYGETARAMQAAGQAAVADAYVADQIRGTPRQILAKVNARRRELLASDALKCVRFAGTPYPVVERTLRTFAQHVIPELRSGDTAPPMAA